ncbi:MAG: DUF3095 family protein [Candidatus Pacebacteria bacterium]|nr:DUF3095 family protein [Candidatus Paceibacterota bacterium]MBP9851161.1 DUF3095 family protein [Candidatus Paceibacterota bacterium]
MATTKNFYTKLPLIKYTLNELLESAGDFESVPEDWTIILTDIVSSTEHFKADRYQEVNFVAVSSVSVVLNVVRRRKITIPFVYGGDGATLFVPPEAVSECKGKLATLRSNVKKRFGMDLRVSLIPVSLVLEAGFPIRVAKLYVSSNYHQAIFLGEGIHYAESLMKQDPEFLLSEHTKHKPIDLSGLECKWNALFPPRKGDEIVSLIVAPLGKTEPEEIFHNVLGEIDRIYGPFSKRHPIHPKTFSPTTHLKTIIHASHLKHGKVHFFYVAKNLILGLWKAARLELRGLWHTLINKEVPDMSTSSDTLKIDNTLKTVFAGSPESRPRFIKWLDEQEEKGELVYGIHVSQSSVMTCYIKESEHMHIRFLDGFGGGYTMASIPLKQKLKDRK